MEDNASILGITAQSVRPPADGETARMQTTGVFLVREQALSIGQELVGALNGELFLPWHNGTLSARDQFRTQFHSRHSWVLVMATGIAVRFIDGLLQDKKTDPAVVVLDEGCNFAIALAGGHEGGANQLALRVASIFGAAPVVTTATESKKPLIVGIGCKRNTSAEAIEIAVLKALESRSISEIRTVATIDLKEREEGLIQFCAKYGLPMRIFKAEQVATRAWVTKPSAWVEEITGAVGVCEPCALMVSPRGKLIRPKQAFNGVTVAVVDDSWSIQS